MSSLLRLRNHQQRLLSIAVTNTTTSTSIASSCTTASTCSSTISSSSSFSTPRRSMSFLSRKPNIDPSVDLSNPDVRAELFAKARYHRHARLWLVAAVTGAAAIATTWRLIRDEEAGNIEIAKQKREIEEMREQIRIGYEEEERRKQALRNAIENVQPLSASTHAVVASSSSPSTPSSILLPTSFLSAALIDLRRSLNLHSNQNAVESLSSTSSSSSTSPPSDDLALVSIAPKVTTAKQDTTTKPKVEAKKGKVIMF